MMKLIVLVCIALYVKYFVQIQSNNQYQMLNIRKLISVSLQLNIEACNIIKDSFLNKNLKKYMKDVDDPVTEADFKVQSMLIKGLKKHFPELLIIGEQTKQYQGEIQFDYLSLNEDFLPSAIQIKQQLPYKQVCLYIDPIDCTKGFVNGRLQDVTILMGLSHSKKACIGIVGIPFKKEGDERIYSPSIIFGSVGEKQTYEFDPKQMQYKKITSGNFKEGKQVRIAISNNRTNQVQQEFIKNMKGTRVQVGGSGRKIIMVARGDVEMMVYLESYTHKWDTCAPQAIIKSLGGYLLSSTGTELVYDPQNKDTRNRQGIVCTLHQSLYKQSSKLLSLQG